MMHGIWRYLCTVVRKTHLLCGEAHEDCGVPSRAGWPGKAHGIPDLRRGLVRDDGGGYPELQVAVGPAAQLTCDGVSPPTTYYL